MRSILLLLITLPLFATFRGELYQNDAACDRTIALPTAETLEQFDLTLNSYNLIIAGVSFGVTDWFQLSATTLFADLANHENSYLLSGKLRLLSSNRSALSLIFGGVYDQNIERPESMAQSPFYLQGGLLYSYINRYRMQFTLGALLVHHATETEDLAILPYFATSIPLGKKWRVLGEFSYLFASEAPAYQSSAFNKHNQFFSFGIRRTGKQFSWDCSLILQKDQGGAPFCSINIRP